MLGLLTAAVAPVRVSSVLTFTQYIISEENIPKNGDLSNHCEADNMVYTIGNTASRASENNHQHDTIGYCTVCGEQLTAWPPHACPSTSRAESENKRPRGEDENGTSQDGKEKEGRKKKRGRISQKIIITGKIDNVRVTMYIHIHHMLSYTAII